MSKSSLKPVKQVTSEVSNKDSMLDRIDDAGRGSRLRASVQQVLPGHLSPRFNDNVV